MKRLKTALACLAVAAATAVPTPALAGPPEHCDGEFGDPCKPFFLICRDIEARTKGYVTCGD